MQLDLPLLSPIVGVPAVVSNSLTCLQWIQTLRGVVECRFIGECSQETYL